MENNFVKYKDLLTIKESESLEEEFVWLPLENDYVIGKYQNKINMLEFGEKIAVRKKVKEKLFEASKLLKKYNQNYKLMVVYGFRDMKLQQKYFTEIYNQVKDNFEDELELYEYIHEKIAVPSVAGHPTGGAVDIAICDINTEEMIDFGSKILDWDDSNCYYNSNNISKEAKQNRKLLRCIMLEVGFAPFDGEWWHFSYGDKEWAFYYNKKKCLYNQINADKVFKKISYINFLPGGNKTALVLENNYSKDLKVKINNSIMEKDNSIEQVGFVDKERYELEMAGGEFCGNASRSAVYYFLGKNKKQIKLKVNSKDIVNAGIDDFGKVWCEMPLNNANQIEKLDDYIYLVRLKGIVIIVLQEDVANLYLKDKDNLKNTGMEFIEKYNLKNNDAVGVMFVEKNTNLKINPIVWVKNINTLFYETACGSGTTAVAMVESFISGKNETLDIIQPSNMNITAKIKIENKIIKKACIYGEVISDFILNEIVIILL